MYYVLNYSFRMYNLEDISHNGASLSSYFHLAVCILSCFSCENELGNLLFVLCGLGLEQNNYVEINNSINVFSRNGNHYKRCQCKYLWFTILNYVHTFFLASEINIR